ncbi:hypothetical protein DFP72DRAFT_853949 [Ephemerocybe angulata]|uniref:Uncharacterized protein n=1 Tax=Ephemerocybe angulata TaxID=980116 RepID=A0A8H6LXR8_9AGAR|nr:hypothetical protein DFP72DRAFT_853949 [Tulosesus angulatus]
MKLSKLRNQWTHLDLVVAVNIESIEATIATSIPVLTLRENVKPYSDFYPFNTVIEDAQGTVHCFQPWIQTKTDSDAWRKIFDASAVCTHDLFYACTEANFNQWSTSEVSVILNKFSAIVISDCAEPVAEYLRETIEAIWDLEDEVEMQHLSQSQRPLCLG